MRKLLTELLLFALLLQCFCAELSLPTDEDTDNELTTPLAANSWLKSAQDVIASPAGHVVVQVAKELLNRSAGNSQVLSLNLTNLLIIVLLKVLIFAAGMLGAGHWSSQGAYGRSAVRSITESLLGFDEGDAYLITGFLAAQGSGVNDCLYAAACNSPNAAYEYSRAAKALLDGIEKFEGQPGKSSQYMELIVLTERAAYDGYRGVPCNISTKCDGLW